MIKLVEDWRNAWKWFSVQSMTIAVSLLGAWELLPADLKATLPGDFTRMLAIVLLAAGLVGRVVDQKKVEK